MLSNKRFVERQIAKKQFELGHFLKIVKGTKGRIN
jgi:hypothetical protein